MLATDVNNYQRATVTPETNTKILVCNAGHTGACLCNRDARGFDDHARDTAINCIVHDSALSSQECQTGLIDNEKKQEERQPQHGKAGGGPLKQH